MVYFEVILIATTVFYPFFYIFKIAPLNRVEKK